MSEVNSIKYLTEMPFFNPQPYFPYFNFCSSHLKRICRYSVTFPALWARDSNLLARAGIRSGQFYG